MEMWCASGRYESAAAAGWLLPPITCHPVAGHLQLFDALLASVVSVLFASAPALPAILLRGWGWEPNASMRAGGRWGKRVKTCAHPTQHHNATACTCSGSCLPSPSSVRVCVLTLQMEMLAAHQRVPSSPPGTLP